MPLQQTSGNVTQDAYGGGVAVEPVYIEQIFSTWLYTGNGSTQTITNGINLSGKGGLVWTKARSQAYSNLQWDTEQGAGYFLTSNATSQSQYVASGLSSFNTNGFSIGSAAGINESATTYVSWTFRKQPKFFDVVTWTGNGNSSSYNISHNLGAQPGFIIVKGVSTASNWTVLARTNSTQYYLLTLNSTAASPISPVTQSTYATSTTIDVGAMKGNLSGDINANGATYVAYLFAHNAGGFGLTGTDNVITCGSFTDTTDSSVNLGYEPQWLLVKPSSAASGWYLFDSMRGLNVTGNKFLNPNTSGAEGTDAVPYNFSPTSTGFIVPAGYFGAGVQCIYIAIRRGPMKVPTDGTTVFAIASAVSTAPAFVSNAVVDAGFNTAINAGSLFLNQARLTGQDYLNTRSTAAAGSDSSRSWDYMKGMLNGQSTNPNNVGWMFGRAPNFFDVVCYTGTGSLQVLTHNLGAVPELIIVKQRNTTSSWTVYAASQGLNTGYLNRGDVGFGNNSNWGNAPTSTTFSVQGSSQNTSGGTYVAYLFATLAGVSKVGLYTGNGTTQTINCNFTTGARFVLIKNADVGDWYVYDTLRGMTTLTDPYVLMNAPAAAQTDTLGSVTTVTTGFAVNAAILAAINTNAASYIFLAIA